MTLFVWSVDCFLNLAGFEFGVEATLVFDFEESLPSLFCDCYSKGFNVVRTTCGVNNLVEVWLFAKQCLLIASKTFWEIVRSFVSLVEWGCCHGINTTDYSRHWFGCRAKQVYVCIVYSLVVFCSICMDTHFAWAVAFWFVFLYNLSPKHTSSSEFSDFHEVVAGNAHIELNLTSSSININTSIGEHFQPLVTPCQCAAKFLVDISAGIIEEIWINGDNTNVLYRSNDFNQLLCGFNRASFEINTLVEQTLERIEVQWAVEFVERVVLGEIFNQCLSCFNSCRRTTNEIHFNSIEVNFVKENGDFVGVQCFMKMEAERVNTFVENFFGFLISSS